MDLTDVVQHYMTRDAEPTWEMVDTLLDAIDAQNKLLLKFARHRVDCRCFICRNLTDHQREMLSPFLKR